MTHSWDDRSAAVAEKSRQFMEVATRLPAPLYVLAEEFNDLIDLLSDPAADPARVEDQLAECTRDIKAKAFGIAEVLRSFERRADDYKREQDRLYAARKVLETATERLKAYTVEQMQSMGIDRIDAGVHTVRLQKNPISVHVTNEPKTVHLEGYAEMPDVPREFVAIHTVYKVKKGEIAAHVKTTGEVVPGTSIERGVSLRVS